MKRLYLSLALLSLFAFPGFAQSYLTPYPGFEARDIFPAYSNFQAIDIYDTLLYGTDGDTIHCLDLPKVFIQILYYNDGIFFSHGFLTAFPAAEPPMTE